MTGFAMPTLRRAALKATVSSSVTDPFFSSTFLAYWFSMSTMRRAWVGGGMEGGWRRDGGGMEGGWRRDGGGMEEGWRRDGEGTTTTGTWLPMPNSSLVPLPALISPRANYCTIYNKGWRTRLPPPPPGPAVCRPTLPMRASRSLKASDT